MNTYLVIITTVLVLTQIIRLTQNYVQLKSFKNVDTGNDNIIRIWGKVERAVEIYLKEKEVQGNE